MECEVGEISQTPEIQPKDMGAEDGRAQENEGTQGKNRRSKTTKDQRGKKYTIFISR